MQFKTDEGMDRGPVSTGSSGKVLLSDEIVSFIESGVSIIVGVVGAEGRAQTGRALAARVVAGVMIRLVYAVEGNSAVTAAAQVGGAIAVTFSAPLSHRTIQVKGSSCAAVALDPEDQASTEQQTAAFSAILSAIGYPPYFVSAFSDYRSSELRALCFCAEAAFEQTPGPGAGRAI
jgi:hypothetical protein